MEKVETIDLSGAQELANKFAAIGDSCGSMDLKSKCSGAEFQSQITEQKEVVETLQDTLNTAESRDVPQYIKKTIKDQKGYKIYTDKCNKWVENYDKDLGKFTCLRSDGNEQTVCTEKELVNGKAVCQNRVEVDRVTYCKEEYIKDGKIACKSK